MRISFLYLIVPALVLTACSSKQDKSAMTAEPTTANTADGNYVSTADSTNYSSDLASLVSPSRKRVRAADVRCRVTNVFKAATQLEHAVSTVRGVIVESNMKNESVQQFEMPYTPDSLKRIQLYTPTANLTLKVPVEHLDTVVGILTSMAVLIDHRLLTDKDYTLDYLSTALKNKASQQVAKVVPDKKTSTLDAARYEEAQKEKAVDRSISNLQILDDVAYATFTVQLFQPEVSDVQAVVNPRQISRAGFGTEMWTATRQGATMLRNILIAMMQVWPFWIAVVLGWLAYRKFLVK